MTGAQAPPVKDLPRRSASRLRYWLCTRLQTHPHIVGQRQTDAEPLIAITKPSPSLVALSTTNPRGISSETSSLCIALIPCPNQSELAPRIHQMSVRPNLRRRITTDRCEAAVSHTWRRLPRVHEIARTDQTALPAGRVLLPRLPRAKAASVGQGRVPPAHGLTGALQPKWETSPPISNPSLVIARERRTAFRHSGGGRPG